MFIQVIEGRARNPRAVREQWDRWQRELAPGATGWLGATGGIAADGTWIGVVRFETREAAQRNSERSEQGRWWADLAQHLEGEATFDDYDQTELLSGGGSDRAGFVQVIRGRSSDLTQLQALGRELEGALRQHRPDVMGGTIAWKPDGNFTQTVYFTSEAEARANEGKRPPELQQFFDAWDRLTENVRYIDLQEPWLSSR
jgi:hypothetical protein